MHIYLRVFVFSFGAACRNLSMFLQKPKMSRCEAKFSPFEGSGRIWPGNDIASMHNLGTCASVNYQNKYALIMVLFCSEDIFRLVSLYAPI